MLLSIRVIFPVSKDSGTTPSDKILFTKLVGRFINYKPACRSIGAVIPSTPGARSCLRVLMTTMTSFEVTSQHTSVSWANGSVSLGIHGFHASDCLVTSSLISCSFLLVNIADLLPENIIASSSKTILIMV